MSKQLAISTCASILAMAAFALFAAPLHGLASATGAQSKGATTQVVAPSVDRLSAALMD